MSISKTLSKFCLIIGVFFFYTLGSFSAQSAMKESERFISETGIYEVYIPKGYTLDEKEFRTTRKSIAYATEIQSIQDQRPLVNTVKKYIVRTEQTFGPPLTEKEQKLLIVKDLNAFVDYYTKLGGRVLSRNNDLEQVGQEAGEVRIAYEDPKLGAQEFRGRVLSTNVTKVHQIVTGPPDIMEEHQTSHFFDSLILSGGLTHERRNLQGQWEANTSPLAIFIAFLPKQAEPFFKEPPQIRSNQSAEVMSAEFFDPIWRHKLKYNVYGYYFGREITPKIVTDVLDKRHVSKRPPVGEYQDLEPFETANGYKGFEIEYRSAGEPNDAYMDFVHIHSRFIGPFLIVQELVGSEHLVKSEFAENLMDETIFQPSVAAETMRLKQQERLIRDAPAERPPVPSEAVNP